MVDRGQTFNVGQTVTILTDDGFLFVGEIVDCRVKLKCKCCDDDRGKDKCDHEHEHEHNHNDDVECDIFIELQLEANVEVGGPPGPAVVAFQEGQIVFINFCQIIAIAPGFPPTKKA